VDEEAEQWVAAAGLALFAAVFHPWHMVTSIPPHDYAVVGDYNVLAGSYTINGLRTGL
jgi:hypothetical protein